MAGGKSNGKEYDRGMRQEVHQKGITQGISGDF